MIAKVIYRVVLQGWRSWSLLKNICTYHIVSLVRSPRRDRRFTEESSVRGVRMDTVNYRKRKFSLRKIFGKTFVRCVLLLN
jgi:hypothetical protein